MGERGSLPSFYWGPVFATTMHVPISHFFSHRLFSEQPVEAFWYSHGLGKYEKTQGKCPFSLSSLSLQTFDFMHLFY